VEDIMRRLKTSAPGEEEDDESAGRAYRHMLNTEFASDTPFSRVLSSTAKLVKARKLPTKRALLKQLRLDPPASLEKLEWFSSLLVTKKVRSESGVLVVTVLSSPFPEVAEEDGKQTKQAFSCAFDCFYCPNQPGQPRSYLRDEPAVLRANQNGFDAVLQFTDRAATLFENGHGMDKIEILILGGTWSSCTFTGVCDTVLCSISMFICA
jgi:histone acetyltransferase (RNA polymerase elongator complex component)